MLKCIKAVRNKKAANRGAENRTWEIPPYAPLPISHLMVLLFYCNYFELQSQYKANGNRYADINSHKPFANFFKLIFEAVEFYGSCASPAILYYHGLSLRFTFSSFTPVFGSVFSTTTDIGVAKSFGQKGVILALQSTEIICRLFDVEAISLYPEQKEKYV